MYVPYLLLFCRLVVLVAFALSFVSKAQDFDAFKRSIDEFALVPTKLHTITALAFLIGEATTVAFTAIGGQFLLPGLLLAVVLFLVFTAALTSVLLRGISTSCSCFGPTSNMVSWYDVLRNMVLTICAITASIILMSSSTMNVTILVAERIVLLFIALTFVIVLIQFRDIVQIMK